MYVQDYFRINLLRCERDTGPVRETKTEIDRYNLFLRKIAFNLVSYLKFTILILIFKFIFENHFMGKKISLESETAQFCLLTYKPYALARFTYHLPLAWYYIVSFYAVKSAATKYSMVTHGTTYTHQIMFCLRSTTIHQQQVHYCWQCMSTPTHIISS